MMKYTGNSTLYGSWTADLNSLCGLSGFTLAEVLITLGIIGIVAAMTMPILMAKYKKMVTVNQLKKQYSLMQNALQYSQSQYGDVEGWEDCYEYYGQRYCDLQGLMKKYLSGVTTVKVFDAKQAQQLTKFELCGSDVQYKALYKENGNATIGFASGDGRLREGSALMPDGACWHFTFRNGSLDNIMNISVDLNGTGGKPNVAGIDYFEFIVTSKGKVIPNPADNCNKSLNDAGIGTGCATKIINDGWKIADDYPWR